MFHPCFIRGPCSIRGHRRHSPARRAAEAIVVAALTLIFVTTWHVKSFVVSGPSMAETLLGPHRLLSCGDCGYRFRSGADQPAMVGKRAVCPNCGDDHRRIDTAPLQAADGVLVDRGAFLWRAPRRWELAAFRAPERASQVYLKRVVGLPGEAIELRHGDVYADGAIQRKNLAQQRALAVTVYDSSQESPAFPPRWLPDGADSAWRRSGSRFVRPETAAATSGREPVDWLTYQHRRRRPGIAGATEERPIADDCGYNQTRPIGESHFVRDLMVRCRMQPPDKGRLLWLLTDGRSQFLVELDFGGGEAAVSQDGRRIGAFALPDRLAADGAACELGLCDEQVLLGLDGRQIAALRYTVPDVPFRPTSRPVAIGARGGGWEIWDLVLSRDVYYTAGRDRGRGDFQDRLGDDEYFVLGDNSPNSLDSRGWARAGVAAGALVGKPFAAYPSSLRVEGGGREFQVPDLARFRYIQ